MTKQKDYSYLINATYGSLTILSVFRDCNKRAVLATCQCSCGNKTSSTSVHALLSGKTTMCKKCSSKLNGDKGRETAISRGDKYIGQVFNYFTIISKATKEEAGRSGKYKCQCVCGNIKYHDLWSLTTNSGKGSKSCGCQQSRLLSLSAGGSGTPNQNVSVNEYIRKQTTEYDVWVKECLEKSNFTCAITGKIGGKLNVHHLSPLCQLIREYDITIDNYHEFKDILFNPDNGIVLSEESHRQLHSYYGREVTVHMIEAFKSRYKPQI